MAPSTRKEANSENDMKYKKHKLKDSYPVAKKLAHSPPQFFVYIDGYNLYSGINHPDPPDLLRLGWCNYQKLGEKLVNLSFDHVSSERNVTVKYFTAKVGKDSGTSGEIERQRLWLDVLQHEAPSLKIIHGLHVPRSADFSSRVEKMTDVNITLHAAQDLGESKPAGMALVSGDRDFMPIIERAATADIPIVVFFPLDHPLYALPPGVTYSERVVITYLTQEILKNCRLSDKRWLEYLNLR